jgi:hypothetical protein
MRVWHHGLRRFLESSNGRASGRSRASDVWAYAWMFHTRCRPGLEPGPILRGFAFCRGGKYPLRQQPPVAINPGSAAQRDRTARSLSSGAHSRDPLALPRERCTASETRDRSLHPRASRLAARCARAFASILAHRRAWGMPGARCTRSLVCGMVFEKAHEYSQRSHRNRPAFPHAMVLTVSFVLSPAIGLFCHRRLAD